MTASSKKVIHLAAVVLPAMAGGAEAHVGHGMLPGFVSDFSHPFTSLGHVLAMLAAAVFVGMIWRWKAS